ncbi:hypothetical protein HDE_04127 [Halotydeus destructor]|nr:hypothetical protein HDE_04127 [Halotydeus destructor]
MNYCNMFQCYSGQLLRDRQSIRAGRGSQLVRVVAQRNTGLVADSFKETPCQLTGHTAPYLWNVPRDMGYNCTAFTDVVGQLSPDGNYTGYIGHLQQGTADYGMVLNPMPFPGDPFDYSTVFSAEKISFATLYKRPRKPQGHTDLMAAILEIDFPSIGVFVSLLALFVAVLRIQRQKRNFFRIVQAFFQHVGLPAQTLGLKCLGLTLIVLFFIIQSFYSNVILVDLVRQENPKVLRHFSDILDPEVDVLVSRTYPILDILKTCENRQVRLLTEKIERLTLDKTLVGEGLDTYKAYIGKPKERLFGHLSFQNMLKNTRMVTCAVMQEGDSQLGEKQSLWIPDDSPFEFLTTAAYSRTLDKGIKQVLDLAMLRGLEHQLYTDILRSRVALKMKELLLPGIDADPLCYSDAILVEEASESDGITLSNFYGVMFVSGIICVFAVLSLLLEMRHEENGVSDGFEITLLIPSR